jgi:hypothetical protein
MGRLFHSNGRVGDNLVGEGNYFQQDAMKKQNTKSPLKASPLRNPGQSLDEEIQRRMDDQAIPWIIAVVMSIVLASLEWYRWYTQAPFSPWGYTVVALIVTVFGIWKLYKIKTEIQRLQLGRDGEKAVGQFLEALRQDGYKIFHDVQGVGFNVDHVVIGPTGIYSIETKTFSKPVDKNSIIVFDGTRITKDGFELDRDPVIQAKAQAKWLSELLESSTNRKTQVKPVVLFPGWFVESGWQSDVWVLNPKALRSFIEKREPLFSSEDVGLFSFHLSRFIRSTF